MSEPVKSSAADSVALLAGGHGRGGECGVRGDGHGAAAEDSALSRPASVRISRSAPDRTAPWPEARPPRATRRFRSPRIASRPFVQRDRPGGRGVHFEHRLQPASLAACTAQSSRSEATPLRRASSATYSRATSASFAAGRPTASAMASPACVSATWPSTAGPSVAIQAPSMPVGVSHRAGVGGPADRVAVLLVDAPQGRGAGGQILVAARTDHWLRASAVIGQLGCRRAARASALGGAARRRPRVTPHSLTRGAFRRSESGGSRTTVIAAPA